MGGMRHVPRRRRSSAVQGLHPCHAVPQVHLRPLERSRRNYRKQYGEDDARIRRRLERERFVLPEGCSFYDLYEQRSEANIGELINIALEKIEDTNRAKLEGVFRNIDFNSESNLGRVKDRNRRLKNMLEDFNKPALDLRPVARQ